MQFYIVIWNSAKHVKHSAGLRFSLETDLQKFSFSIAAIETDKNFEFLLGEGDLEKMLPFKERDKREGKNKASSESEPREWHHPEPKRGVGLQSLDA